jgi:hypothetical protein
MGPRPERLVNLSTLEMMGLPASERSVMYPSNGSITPNAHENNQGRKAQRKADSLEKFVPITNKQAAEELASRKLVDCDSKWKDEGPSLARRQELQQQAMDLVLEGRSYEYVAFKLTLPTSEVHSMIQETLGRWIHLESLTALELRELESKRLDKVYALAITETFPHPIISQETGMPVLNAHGDPIMSQANPVWAKISIEIMNRRAALYGLDAAVKLQEKMVDVLERKYIGASPDDL